MRGWFLRRKLDKDQKGFSLIEMVIAIPLIALSGGFVVAIIGQSFSTINTNQAIDSAGVEIQNIMDDAKNSKTCYDLNKIKGNKSIKNIAGSNHPTDFTVTTTYSPTCVEYGEIAKKGQVITVNSEAKRDSDNKILFKNSTSVLIKG